LSVHSTLPPAPDLPDENSVRYEGWRVAAASGLTVFFASLVVYTFGVLLRPLTVEFSWTREAVSIAYGVAAVASAFASVPLGYVCDRFGARAVVLPSLVVYSLAFASLGVLTPNLWHLYGVFAVLGVTATGMSPVALARAISTWFVRRRGLALAVAIAGASIGGVVYPAVTQPLTDRFGWRSTCVVLGALVLAAGMPIVLRFVRPRRAAGRHAADSSGVDLTEGSIVRDGLRSRVFWILIVVLFCAGMAQSGAIVHLVALLTDRGIAPGAAAIALSSMGVANIVGRILTGWLIDRFFAARVCVVLLAVVAVGVYLLSVASSLQIGIVAAVLIGFGMGGESDITPYLLSRYFGLRSFSTLYGFAWIATGASGAAGPIVLGRAFDAGGSYQAPLVTVAVVTFGAATLMLVLPRYERMVTLPARVE
jgi:MFS family permease